MKDPDFTERRKIEKMRPLKLESQVDSLRRKAASRNFNLKLDNNSVLQCSHTPWSELSRQQQYHRKRKMAKDLKNITSFCDSNYKPCNIEL